MPGRLSFRVASKRWQLMLQVDKYNEWFIMAQKDLRSAKILFDHSADHEILCFH